jgi:C-5 cytosine-specific DNA methylase
MKPLAIDLFCGLGGWAEGFLAEGYDVVGFDIERHDYGTGGYPGQLVLQDVHTLDGKQFRDADVIVASPPCTQFSFRGRYGRKKNLPRPHEGIALFEACFRIQAEATEANCEPIPLIVENVVWAQEFVGMARTNWGSQYLWGDVPPLLPHRRAYDFRKGNEAGLSSRRFGSKTLARKRATAELSKIPFPLAQHIARVF